MLLLTFFPYLVIVDVTAIVVAVINVVVTFLSIVIVVEISFRVRFRDKTVRAEIVVQTVKVVVDVVVVKANAGCGRLYYSTSLGVVVGDQKVGG